MTPSLDSPRPATGDVFQKSIAPPFGRAMVTAQISGFAWVLSWWAEVYLTV